MVFRSNGYTGCLFGIVFLLIMFSLLRFTGWIFFGTPVGLVLIGYFAYRHFKNKNEEPEISQASFEQEPEFNNQESVIDVDFEEVDSNE